MANACSIYFDLIRNAKGRLCGLVAIAQQSFGSSKAA
jgi:hypothetical protein